MLTSPSINKIFYSSGSNLFKKYFEINGLSDVSLENSISLTNEFSLGLKNNSSFINSPLEIKFSFTRDYVNNDYLLNFTGESPIEEIYFFNGNDYFLIKNLYLTNYSASFSVGSIPSIKNDFVAYGEKINQIQYIDDSYEISKVEIDIPKLNSIYISGLYEGINKQYGLYEFNYSLNINRQPFYSIGNLSPVKISTIFPHQVQSSLNFVTSKQNYFENIVEDNFKKSYKDFDILVSGSNYISSFPMRNSSLINSSISLSSDSSAILTKNYIGYYGLQ